MNDRLVEDTRGQRLLTTDRARIDVEVVHAMLVASHWGGQITRPILGRSIENSICLGVYEAARQVGFARVVTDLSTYAYLAEVIVADDVRGQGIGSWMVEVILAHPDLQGLRRFSLLTRDAKRLYERYGFSTDLPGSLYMELRPKR